MKSVPAHISSSIQEAVVGCPSIHLQMSTFKIGLQVSQELEAAMGFHAHLAPRDTMWIWPYESLWLSMSYVCFGPGLEQSQILFWRNQHPQCLRSTRSPKWSHRVKTPFVTTTPVH